jgi:hypothetical protein
MQNRAKSTIKNVKIRGLRACFPVYVNDHSFCLGQTVTCLQIHVNPRILPVHLLYF